MNTDLEWQVGKWIVPRCCLQPWPLICHLISTVYCLDKPGPVLHHTEFSSLFWVAKKYCCRFSMLLFMYRKIVHWNYILIRTTSWLLMNYTLLLNLHFFYYKLFFSPHINYIVILLFFQRYKNERNKQWFHVSLTLLSLSIVSLLDCKFWYVLYMLY